MNKHGKRSLESLKIFPFVAWTLVIAFAFFVYNLTSHVEETTELLQDAQVQKFNTAQVESRTE